MKKILLVALVVVISACNGYSESSDTEAQEQTGAGGFSAGGPSACQIEDGTVTLDSGEECKQGDTLVSCSIGILRIGDSTFQSGRVTLDGINYFCRS